MSKFKIFIWIIILAIVVTVLLQNETVFLAKQAIGINLYFVQYKTPELPTAIYFLTTLIIGLFISYLFGLSDKFKARKAIKGLTATLDSQRQELASLKQEIETLKKKPPEASAQPFTPKMDSTDIVEAELQPATQEDDQSNSEIGETQQETEKSDSGEDEEKK